MSISVAMAVYNGEKYIEKQLSSLLAQTRRPDEVIITDDCSTDSTVEKIKKFISDNSLSDWKLYTAEENSGYKRNFLRAISLAQGDIIFTCDQDDIWQKEKLEIIERFFAANPDAYAVSSGFYLIDEFDKEIEKSDDGNYGLINVPITQEFQKISLKTVLHSNISPGCTSAFRWECAQIFLKNSTSELPHDYELNLIAAGLGGLYFTPKKLICYRLHSNNTLGFDGLKQTRTEIAREKLKACEVVNYASGNTSLYEMQKARLNALEQKNLTEVLKLNFNKNYIQMFSIRERLGDILYIFRREK